MLLSVFLLSKCISVRESHVPTSGDVHSVESYKQLDLRARDLL